MTAGLRYLAMDRDPSFQNINGDERVMGAKVEKKKGLFKPYLPTFMFGHVRSLRDKMSDQVKQNT